MSKSTATRQLSETGLLIFKAMTQEELIQFLQENLTIEVYRPEHDVGYYSSCIEPDEHNITVEIQLCGNLICKSTSY